MSKIFPFITGFIFGAAIGYVVRKKIIEQKEINAENEEIIKDGFSRISEEEGYVTKDQNEERIAPETGRMGEKERKEIKEKLNQNWDKTTDYAAMYKYKDFENEEDNSDEERVQKEGENPEEDAFLEHQKTKDRPPRIISAEAYANLDTRFDKEVLYYYTFDDILSEENGEEVEVPEILVGDTLTKYGFTDSDEEVIFVINYAIDTAYEIQKIDAMWATTNS